MTTAAIETTSNLSELSLLHDDPILGFSTDSCFEPPLFDPKSPETSQERFTRISDETDYCNDTNCMLWYRYVTLGRYVVKGHNFDNIINNIERDPLKAHSLIWYQYMYHVDRKIDIPEKLKAWATTKSMTYLANILPVFRYWTRLRPHGLSCLLNCAFLTIGPLLKGNRSPES
jgi:hypothetical protein